MLRDLARILLAAALMSCGRQEPGGPASGRQAGFTYEMIEDEGRFIQRRPA